MAMNPMQRKARQSFFLGMLITLLITGAIIAFLFMQMKNLKEKVDADTTAKNKVYVLRQDVKSGQTLTMDMFEQREVTKNAIPADATDVSTSEKTLMAKVDMKANTILTTSMVEVEGEEITKDTREQTYNMISLPIDLVNGEYVDIRLKLPNGQDYIVLSKKKATIPNVSGEYLKDTIKLTLSEGELLTLSGAIVESYQITGATLYAIKYVEAGNQAAAIANYVPSNELLQEIQKNPNIVSEALTELKSRWTQDAIGLRKDYINKQERDEEAAKTGIKESMEKTQKSREQYLETVFAE